MSRIGSTIRSAKTNASTPPKLIPPFQRIAASGTFPIEPAPQEAPEHDREQDDHQRPADELAERELPAEDERHQDPQLDHEVRGGELEGRRGGEVGAPPEKRAG